MTGPSPGNRRTGRAVHPRFSGRGARGRVTLQEPAPPVQVEGQGRLQALRLDEVRHGRWAVKVAGVFQEAHVTRRF